MQTRRATELSNKSGEILDNVLISPILITKGRNERPVAVLMSFVSYQELISNQRSIPLGQGNVDETLEMGVNIVE